MNMLAEYYFIPTYILFNAPINWFAHLIGKKKGKKYFDRRALLRIPPINTEERNMNVFGLLLKSLMMILHNLMLISTFDE
jgi:hypothetical protein